jgi:AraC-like DNA-binding protein
MNIPVQKNTIVLTGNEISDPARRHWWTSIMLNSYGMTCKLDTSGSADSIIQEWTLGELPILDLRMTKQLVAPTLRDSACWNGDHLFLKVVKSGSISIEQNGESRVFGPNSLIITDPLHSYVQSFDESTSLGVLRLSKETLRVRGLPYNFPEVHDGDLGSPDVQAVRDVILMLIDQSSTVSRELGHRLSQQCLDLMDVVLNGESKSGRKRTGAAALVLRAKQVILRLARNPDLDMNWIARELSVSPNYLTRAFKATGQTPMRYLMSVRLGFAAKLLVEQNAKVKEIAFRCGFASSSHFCSVFKRRFGMSPQEFAFTQRASRLPGHQTVKLD